MSTARPGRSKNLTPAVAKQRLIDAGFDPAELEAFLKMLARIQKGDFFLPVTSDQSFHRPARHVKGLAKKLWKLADQLDCLWSEKGKSALAFGRYRPEVLSLPGHLRLYSVILKGTLNTGGKKLPTVKKVVRIELIQRTKQVTNGWRDAELAVLCDDTTENWKAWRKKWCPAMTEAAGLSPPPGYKSPL